MIYEIDLQFQNLTSAREILNDLCMNAALAADAGLTDTYCNIYIPVSKSVTVFAEVQIVNGKTLYYVTSSKNKSATIQPISYRAAVSKLQLLTA